MFDCGIPFKKMKPELYKCRTLLITHSHSDHVKESTLQAIRSFFPYLTICGNADVAYRWQMDHVVGTAPFDTVDGLHVIPFDGTHDVPVTGYVVQHDNVNWLYMTDTHSVTLPEDIPLDYVFLESNYDERLIQILAKQYRAKGYDPTVQAYRHLSKQKCKEFFFTHRRNNESHLIELHKSTRFYE